MTKIMKIAKIRIMILKDVSINKDLTEHRQRQRSGTRTRIVVNEFINTGNIHSLIGWETKTITMI